jgi:rfaE bifunctional protein nucleotidyltransferase chain/domain
MDLAKKVLSAPDLHRWRNGLRQAGKKLVVTNGCFDLLHLGHVTYLEKARQQGDALLVGVTNDAGVRALKGAGRPLNSAKDRAVVLAALQSVDAVHVFPEMDARVFLQKVKPDVYVKGGDYTLETINQDERLLLQDLGVEIVLLPLVPGKSTSALLEKIHRL